MVLSKESRERLGAESYYWILLFVFMSVWIPFRLFLPLTLQVRHTYELPSTACTNRLTSDRWTWEFMREALFPLFLLLPLTGAFMIWTRSKTGLWVHIVVIFTLSLWSIIMLGYDIADVRNANLPPSHPSWNPALLSTDQRWCLVYAGQPGTDIVCANTGPCMGPGVSAIAPDDLRTDGPFAFRVAFNVLLLAFCLVDFIFTVWTWWVVLRDWDYTVCPRTEEDSPSEPLMPSPPVEEAKVKTFAFDNTKAPIGQKYTLLKDRYSKK